MIVRLFSRVPSLLVSSAEHFFFLLEGTNEAYNKGKSKLPVHVHPLKHHNYYDFILALSYMYTCAIEVLGYLIL